MRAAVAEADQDRGVVQQFGHAVDARVERRHGEFEFEVVGQGQVEEGIDAVLALRTADLRHRHAFETLEFRRAHFMQGNALPVAEGHWILQFLPELVAERVVAIDRLLRLFRLVLEYPLPRRERRKRERAVHVDFARERQRRSLRPRALGDHRRGATQRFTYRFGYVVAVEQRNESDGAPALVEQEIERLALVFLEHADLPRERHFDRALVLFPEHIRIRLQFVATGIAAGQRPPAVAEMLVQDRAGKSESACIHGAAEQRLDFRGFISRGGPLHRFFAHDVVPERGQRCEETEVHRRLAPCRGIHEFGESLPVPGDAFRQHFERNGFDVDEVAHRDLARLGFARRDSHAAIAHHHAGYAVPRRRRHRAVPADLRVVMGMRIDEARRHDAIGCVDGLSGAAADAADLDDLPAVDGNVRVFSRRAGPVDDEAVLDQQVVRHERSPMGRLILDISIIVNFAGQFANCSRQHGRSATGKWATCECILHTKLAKKLSCAYKRSKLVKKAAPRFFQQ